MRDDIEIAELGDTNFLIGHFHNNCIFPNYSFSEEILEMTEFCSC